MEVHVVKIAVFEEDEPSVYLVENQEFLDWNLHRNKFAYFEKIGSHKIDRISAGIGELVRKQKFS